MSEETKLTNEVLQSIGFTYVEFPDEGDVWSHAKSGIGLDAASMTLIGLEYLECDEVETLEQLRELTNYPFTLNQSVQPKKK